MAKGQRVVVPASLVPAVEEVQARELLDSFGEAVSWVIRDWVKCRTECPSHSSQPKTEAASSKGVDLDSVLNDLV
ncbi:MAG: hypothetical protein HC899_35485 [Leptolyngbyaceae cyanobacterium SM1_4_3]|nr:hypothetical protein [Leptolyngbyaceae cyanobacterium SM1_4_3]